MNRRQTLIGATALLLGTPSGPTPASAQAITPEEARAIAREATIYGFPLVDSYRIQYAYFVDRGSPKLQTLSQFLGQPAPAAAPPVDFIKPLTPEQERRSPEFFNILNFILQFCPTEQALMARFTKLNIGGGKTFDATTLPAETHNAVEDGMADAWKAFNDYKTTQLDTGKRGSGSGFGTRAFLNNDYMSRMVGAVLGIYGNSSDEAIYPVYFVDATKPMLGGSHRYTLRLAPGQLPPAHAFWSLTLYELPSSLLFATPLNRYLINTPIVPKLGRDADGAITLHIQNGSPGVDKEANWLPAPKGPLFMAMRLYWPKPTALDGTWKAPGLQRLN